MCKFLVWCLKNNIEYPFVFQTKEKMHNKCWSTPSNSFFSTHIYGSFNSIGKLSEVDNRSSWTGIWKEGGPGNSSKCNYWGKLTFVSTSFTNCHVLYQLKSSLQFWFFPSYFFMFPFFNSWMSSYYQSNKVHSGKCGWLLVVDIKFFFSPTAMTI